MPEEFQNPPEQERETMLKAVQSAARRFGLEEKMPFEFSKDDDDTIQHARDDAYGLTIQSRLDPHVKAIGGDPIYRIEYIVNRTVIIPGGPISQRVAPWEVDIQEVFSTQSLHAAIAYFLTLPQRDLITQYLDDEALAEQYKDEHRSDT